MSHAKNQHYVSRLYLRQFAFEAGKNPHIYAFDKTTRRVIRPSIRNIAAEMHFYESSDTGIERALGMVEDNFVPAYRLIREIDDIAALGPSERAAIAIFIAVQRHATRFVFSRSGEFNLANQVLDAYPQVGDPARKRTRS